MRRTQPLHAAAFLVDQDRRLAAYSAAELLDQAAQRVGVRDIALEDDETPRLAPL